MDHTWRRAFRMAQIGRGTWIDKLAAEVLERERRLGRSLDMIRVESGLGASGIPHIGSLGDAVRSYGVKMALEDMGYGSALLAYSDDMDGLRKIPEGLPAGAADTLRQYIARPVSLIPDPFGCCDSYGSHMSGMLLDGLDRLGIRYEFRRAYDTYRNGLLAEQTHTILNRAARIGDVIMEMVGQDKYTKMLPYFAVCEECHRIYTTVSYEYDAESRRVVYRCGDTQLGGDTIRGCGHRGTVRIDGGLGKLAWKVEFAARWSAFDVRFEAYGKDIMDSVEVNDRVSAEILDRPPPHHIRYEMFLDSGGKKISKSSGNVVTAQDWLDVGSAQSLLMLLYKRIRGARHLGMGDVPALMREYDELEDVYFGRTRPDNAEKAVRQKGLYQYANLLSPPAEPPVHVNYTLLVELARIFREDRTDHIVRRLVKYGVIPDEGTADGRIRALIGMAGRFADTHRDMPREAVETDPDLRRAIGMLAESLRLHPDADPQGAVFEAARAAGVRPREFFPILYRILLGSGRGPRLGPLISDMGPERVTSMLEAHV